MDECVSNSDSFFKIFPHLEMGIGEGQKKIWFVCLFVLGFIVPLENFLFIWKRHHDR